MHAPRILTEWEILNRSNLGRTSSILPPFRAKLIASFRDANGNLKREAEIPFKSFVSNFARILNFGFFNVYNTADGETIDQITTASGTVAASSVSGVHTYDVLEGQKTADTGYGIWIGKTNGVYNSNGDTVTTSAVGIHPSYDDYTLSGLISPTATIIYGATSMSNPNSSTLRVTRRFTNNTAYTIYVDEVGLLGNSGLENVLLARDRVQDGLGNFHIAIPPGEIVDFTYVFTVTAESGYVSNFLQFMSSDMRDSTPIGSIYDTDGTVRTPDFTTGRSKKNLLATANDDNFGLLIGGRFNTLPTFPPPLSATSYKLNNQLTDTYMDHSAVSALGLEKTDGSTIFGLYRDFENVQDYNIYLNEYGIVINDGTYNYLLARARLSSSGSDYITVEPDQIFRLKTYFKFPVNPLGSVTYDD